MVASLCRAPEARLEPPLTGHAARGERQDLEARLRDFLAALAADPIAAGVHVGERPIDLFQLSTTAATTSSSWVIDAMPNGSLTTSRRWSSSRDDRVLDEMALLSASRFVSNSRLLARIAGLR